jgi:hypothetical protein
LRLFERLGSFGRSALGFFDFFRLLIEHRFNTRHLCLKSLDPFLHPLKLLLRLGFPVLKAFDILLFPRGSLDKDIQALLKLLQLLLLKLAPSGKIRSEIYEKRAKIHAVQVRKPGDLSFKAQSSLTFFLCELQLTSFIVPDICYAYLAAKIAKNLVLSRIHNRR